ncbi:MAG: phosphatidylglycerophosphatase A [Verrucomicrobia bacterium]|nr:phosphatidylglycerophosphatase A [Verrucomicrobiota bacterium]
MSGSRPTDPAPRPRLELWLAQGLGLGRLPCAPGTWGSLAGLGWFALLSATASFWAYLAGVIGGFLCAVWLCGVAAESLGHPDPPSVVLDEIVAVPVCFVVWIGMAVGARGHWPPPGFCFGSGNWLPTLGILVLFRLFDVVKPWPVRQSQALPRGWGIAIDDTLAALYVNLVVGVVALLHHWLVTGHRQTGIS